MKFVDEFRDPAASRKLLGAIEHLAGDRLATTSSWRCAGGTPTPSTSTASNDLLPDNVELVHGRAARCA